MKQRLPTPLITANREDLENFIAEVKSYLNSFNSNESEENQKGSLVRFLNITFYKDKEYVKEPKSNIDLIIRENRESSPPLILIECKDLKNKQEFPTTGEINKKALQQLLYYYLGEVHLEKNTSLKNLIITNGHQFFIFDALNFHKLFENDTSLKKDFLEFKNGEKSGNDTKYFYSKIVSPFIENIKEELSYHFFDITTLNLENDSDKLFLYNSFHPSFLLKKHSHTETNTLDKGFYTELLYIMGLEEVTDSGKLIITRSKTPIQGSLFELIQFRLKDKDLSKIENSSNYGESKEKQLFNITLELLLLWINRILFIKLLESSLFSFNRKGDDKDKYSFFNHSQVKSFSNMYNLFFNVLALKEEDRSDHIKKDYNFIPYLNSSLFEMTSLENSTINIDCLEELPLSLKKDSILKGASTLKPIISKREVTTLEYLFLFLESYDFSSVKSSPIKEDKKTLINAAVLGLLFEKLNGYNDGAFFTPSSVTMNMAKQSIELATINKFNDVRGWNCKSIDDVRNNIHIKGSNADTILEANKIFNSITICDPSVGSGHFLVSALNQLILSKFELGILANQQGRLLTGIKITIENDELILYNTNQEHRLWYYNRYDEKDLFIQQLLFKEKRSLIENSLFGVDINLNSVRIACLRMWIELLKVSYYETINSSKMETLPNLDINIKYGDSLLQRFGLTRNIHEHIPNFKSILRNYREWVSLYKSTSDKETKSKLLENINSFKSVFTHSNPQLDTLKKELNNLTSEFLDLSNTPLTDFEDSISIKKKLKERLSKIEIKIEKKNLEIAKLISLNTYDKALEWRYEFPEILDSMGDFIGFDLIIGNPPYISAKDISNKQQYRGLEQATGQMDLYALFIELSYNLLAKNGINSLIVPDSILGRSNFASIRKLLYEKTTLLQVIHIDNVFTKASVSSLIYLFQKSNLKPSIKEKEVEKPTISYFKYASPKELKEGVFQHKDVNYLTEEFINSHRILFLDKSDLTIIRKYFSHPPLSQMSKSWRGEEIGKTSPKIDKTNTDKASLPLVTGVDVLRYAQPLYKNRISINNISKPLSLYSKEKLLIRQLGSNLTIGYDTTGSVTIQSVYNLISTNTDIDNRYILAILNSSLTNYIYHSIYSEKLSFPRILLENLRSLTIPILSTNAQKPYISLVRKILENKALALDTLELEVSLNKMIYTLYGLTDKEIEIIEFVKIHSVTTL